MLILGIDPGLRTTGYGEVELSERKLSLVEAGVIRTSEHKPLPQRLEELAQGLLAVLQELSPQVMVVEKLYSHYKHPATAILMGHARGVLLLCAAQAQVPVVNYSATRIKKALTGNGRAGKHQVQKAVQHALRLSELPRPADVADALALALCHASLMQKPELASPPGRVQALQGGLP